MTQPSLNIRMALTFLIFAMLVLLGAIPQRHIPAQLTSFVAAEGDLRGKPTSFGVPTSRKAKVPMRIELRMTQGACRVSCKQGNHETVLFWMGTGSMRHALPAGSELILDPQGGQGRYELMIGPEWHPLAPKTRRFVFLPMAITGVLVGAFAGGVRARVNAMGAKRIIYVSAIAALSGLILYPAVHEGGHMLFGIVLGAKPNWPGVVWTALSGEEPHASFNYLPEAAGSWMSAGGPILPTVVALVLLLAWRIVRKHASWYVSAALVPISVLFLFSAVGCVFELYSRGHMDALSVHFGLTGVARIGVSVSPFLVMIAVYSWLFREYRAWKSRPRVAVAAAEMTWATCDSPTQPQN